MRILIIDDEPGLRQTTTLILADEGYEATACSDGEEGLARCREFDPDLVLCDVRMPRMTGIAFLQKYREEGGRAMVIMMTAYGSTELAIDAMKKGAYDYLPKPFSADQLVLTVRKAIEREALRREVTRLREEVRIDRRFGDLIVRSPAMKQAFQTASKVAKYPSSVLITGESGTGKEVVARLIHTESDRKDAPFIPINCAAIPENLLEAELFGYSRGAFTGADREREGLFEAASGGTLFLDEIGDMPASLQAKLLRVLQEGNIRRLGENHSRDIDARIVAATHHDLDEEVKRGDFRRDLFYRIAVVPIHLIPLRQRRDEIPAMANHFVEVYGRKFRLQDKTIDAEAMRLLLEYPWPGNVRELENVIERSMVLSEGDAIRAEDLPPHVRSPVEALDEPELMGDDLSVKRHGAVLERRLIRMALERTGGNKTRAADLLELSSRALLYKIRDYGLE